MKHFDFEFEWAGIVCQINCDAEEDEDGVAIENLIINQEDPEKMEAPNFRRALSIRVTEMYKEWKNDKKFEDQLPT